jgi:hypothetical protein
MTKGTVKEEMTESNILKRSLDIGKVKHTYTK